MKFNKKTFEHALKSIVVYLKWPRRRREKKFIRKCFENNRWVPKIASPDFLFFVCFVCFLLFCFDSHISASGNLRKQPGIVLPPVGGGGEQYQKVLLLNKKTLPYLTGGGGVLEYDKGDYRPGGFETVPIFFCF